MCGKASVFKQNQCWHKSLYIAVNRSQLSRFDANLIVYSTWGEKETPPKAAWCLAGWVWDATETNTEMFCWILSAKTGSYD